MKIELGQTRKESYGGRCGAEDSHEGEKKSEEKHMNEMVYPSLYIHNRKGNADLPDEGEAKIKYKVRSRTTENRDGKESFSMDLEIMSIETLGAKSVSNPSEDMAEIEDELSESEKKSDK